MEHWPMTADDVLLMYPGAEATAEDRQQIELLLELAEARLVYRVPSLPSRVESGEVPLVLVKGAICEVVGRVVMNESPHVQSFQSGAGPFQLTERMRWGTDRVQWGAADLAELLPRGGSSLARTIRVRVGW